jgi:hypothetical protein
MSLLRRFAPACLCVCCAFPLAADPNRGHIFEAPLRKPRAPQEIPEICFPQTEAARLPEPRGGGLILPEISGGAFINKEIMGRGKTGKNILESFLLEVNNGANRDFVRELVAYYIEEAAAEGVNHDVAFVQMCLETGFLRYGGLVTEDMNNFCGLGSTGPGEPGLRFSSANLGVRAHIQHLKAYATEKPLERELVDPRNRWVKKGSVPIVKKLAGTWAADRQYADKLGVILKRLYQFEDSVTN